MHTFPLPHRTVDVAVRAEAAGFDGLLVADSEVLVGDPYVELALAAQATRRIRLGLGTTNPVTRHPAVTASALATLQVESGGRAAVVIGRGDSAVLQVGLEPATTTQLRESVADLKDFLGQPVPGPRTLKWYAPYAPAPVPISIAATGPRTVAMAAASAVGVDLTVGADPRRVKAAVDLARAHAAGEGSGPPIGVWVNVAVSADPATARELVRGSAAIFAHFVSEGPLDGLSAADRAVVEPLRRGYVEADHGLSSAAHAGRIPDDFIDRFTVAGTPDHVVDRLHRLAAIGVDRIVVVPGSRDDDPDLLAASDELFAHEVLPRLRDLPVLTGA